MKSPLSYLGGKSRLANKIAGEIPADHTCYCEPFCGACWVLFAKEPSKAEVINDVDSELVTFWRVVQNHLQEFLRYYKLAVTSREIFEIEKRKDPTTLTDIQRATRYFYLQKHSFGGRTHGRTFGTSATGPSRLNLLNLEDHILEVHWRFNGVQIENLPAVECIRRYDRPHTFFYCDPPYYQVAGYRAAFTEKDYNQLARTLAGIKGLFLLSLNDCKCVRKVFKSFHIRSIPIKYTCSNGRHKTARQKVSKEVLIRNY